MPANTETEFPSSATTSSSSTDMSSITTIPTSTDASPTTTATNKPPKDRKSAMLGYSHPLSMYRNESKNINVYVSISNKESIVKDTLQRIVDEQSSHDGDSISINLTNVIWYRSLDITLVDPAGDFVITPIHNSSKQIIDTVDGNRWRWAIKTTTDKSLTEIILKVVAEKPDGTVDHFEDKTIHIQIRIDRNIIRRFLNYLTDNPAVSIPIILSLFGFLGWYIKHKVEQKKQK